MTAEERWQDSLFEPSIEMFAATSTPFNFTSFLESSLIFSENLASSSSSSLLTFSNYVSEHVSDVMDVATTKFKENVRRSPSPQMSVEEEVIRSDQHPWTDLPLDLGAYIADYLTPEELCTLAVVDKFSYAIFHHLARESSGYWQRAFSFRYPSAMVSSQTSLALIHSQSLVNYLQCNLLESQSEFRHYQSLSKHYNAIATYHRTLRASSSSSPSSVSAVAASFLHSFSSTSFSPSTSSSGIIGLVCDLAWTDSPLLSAVLSKKRYMTMSTILTHTINDVQKFKKTMNCDGIRSFLPIRSSPSGTLDPDLLRVQSSDHLVSTTPGFIGYAVNLLRLSSTYEYLRYTVFWGLFRDLMVFDKRTSSELYSRSLTPEEMEKYWVVTLEDYSEEILQDVYPRLGVMRPRQNFCELNEEDMMRQLEARVENAVVSYSIARCTY
jgi:hypothetical protein